MKTTCYTAQKVLIMVFILGLLGLAGPAMATVDHSCFFNDRLLNTGPEVTQVCLECHDGAAAQVMKSTHWTWSSKQKVNGKDVLLGKKNAVNNF